MDTSGKGTKPCPLCGRDNPVDATTCAQCNAHLRRKAQAAVPDDVPLPSPPPPRLATRAASADVPPDVVMMDAETIPYLEDQAPEATVVPDRNRPAIPPPFPGAPPAGRRPFPGAPPPFPGSPPAGQTASTAPTVPAPRPPFPGAPPPRDADTEVVRPPRFPGDVEADMATTVELPRPPVSRRALDKPLPAPLIIKRERRGPAPLVWSAIVLLTAVVVGLWAERFGEVAWVTIDNGLPSQVVAVVQQMQPVNLPPSSSSLMGFDVGTRMLEILGPGDRVLEAKTIDTPRPPLFRTQHFVYNVRRATHYALHTADSVGRLTGEPRPFGNELFFMNPAEYGPGQPIKYRGVFAKNTTTVLGHYPIHRTGECCAWLRQLAGAETYETDAPSSPSPVPPPPTPAPKEAP